MSHPYVFISWRCICGPCGPTAASGHEERCPLYTKPGYIYQGNTTIAPSAPHAGFADATEGVALKALGFHAETTACLQFDCSAPRLKDSNFCETHQRPILAPRNAAAAPLVRVDGDCISAWTQAQWAEFMVLRRYGGY